MKTTEEKISCDIHHYKQTLREFYSNAAAILLAAVIGSALVICFDISIDTKVTLVKLLMGCGVVGILAVVVQFVRFAAAVCFFFRSTLRRHDGHIVGGFFCFQAA